jgi:hypothetical protein
MARLSVSDFPVSVVTILVSPSRSEDEPGIPGLLIPIQFRVFFTIAIDKIALVEIVCTEEEDLWVAGTGPQNRLFRI